MLRFELIVPWQTTFMRSRAGRDARDRLMEFLRLPPDVDFVLRKELLLYRFRHCTKMCLFDYAFGRAFFTPGESIGTSQHVQ